MKKFFSILLALTVIFTMAACGHKDDPTEPSDNPLAQNAVKLISFDYGDVTLSDGLFKDSYTRTMDYYLGLSVDDMLYGMHTAAGLPTGSGRDLNLGVGGNVMGQWMQANARYYAAVKDAQILARVTEFCDGLYEISQRNPLFFDGTSMYAFEKYLRGCVDLYTCCGLEKGLEMAVRMVEHAMADDRYVNAEKLLGNNGPDQEIECYTMSESLYAFAEAARTSGAPTANVRRYREFAASFEYREFWDIFRNNRNIFDYSPQAGQNTKYFHAYSHLNSFNSAAAAYAIKNDPYYLTAMINFYDWMRKEQELATGGYGAHVEWLAPAEEIIGFVQNYHDNFETQCDTYACYRLSNYLMNYTGKAGYGNWSEKLLYNSTIASLDIRDGYAFYYSDYNVDGGQKDLHWSWQWSCCSGTRPLVVNEVLRTAYFHDTENLYVNLYTNSSVDFDRKGVGVKLTQKSNFPASDRIDFTLNTDRTETFFLKFRKPEWLAGNASASVNGESVTLAEDSDGWLVLRRSWQNGDKISLTLPMAVGVSKLEREFDSGPDGIYAVTVGPVTLAAQTASGTKPGKALDGQKELISQLTMGADRLHYSAVSDPDVTFKPFYEYGEKELYYLYFNLYRYSIFD